MKTGKDLLLESLTREIGELRGIKIERKQSYSSGYGWFTLEYRIIIKTESGKSVFTIKSGSLYEALEELLP